MKLRPAIAAALALIGALSPAGAQQAVTESTVTFAQIAALEGQGGPLGQGLRIGILAAFEEVNRTGGVNSRILDLQSFDDGNEPDRAVALGKSVAQGDAQLAILATTGTATSQAIEPVASASGIAFVGALSGAALLREARLDKVFNLRPSDEAEAEALIAHLIDQRKFKKIAVLFQDDGFGRSGLEALTTSLSRRGLSPVATGSYTRNTLAVKAALLTIRKAAPDAVVMVGLAQPVAEFVRVAGSIGFSAQFAALSPALPALLTDELGAAAQGMLLSEVVPSPYDTAHPLVARYQQALAGYDPEARPDHASLEGYLIGRIVVLALENAGPWPTRASFVSGLAMMSNVDLGGLTIGFGPGDNQALETASVARIGAGGGLESLPN